MKPLGWHRGGVAVLAACVTALAARDVAYAKRQDTGALEATVSVEEAYTDNVRWAADGPDKEESFITSINGGVDWNNEEIDWLPEHVSGGVRGRIFHGFSERDYAELRTEIEHEVADTGLSLEFRYVPERLELEDEPDAGEVTSAQYDLVFGVERRFFQKKLRVRAELETEWERSNESYDDRDSFSPAGVLDVRWHVHRMIVPRVEVRYGVRDANAENYDRDELDLGAGFDLYPVQALQVRLRYERLNREYTTDALDGTSSNSNYDREDDADQIDASVDWTLPRWDAWRLQGRYRLRDNRSTRDNRDFEVNEVGIGVAYTFR